jgi:AraC family transcriptional regulator
MNNNRLRIEYVSRINKVLDYIQNNLDKDLTLESLSEVASFSPYHFHRIFKVMVGETINDYCNRIRLQKTAGMLLSYPDMSITEIALDCGFSSSSHFARSFKKHFQISATSFRKQKDSNSKTNSNICITKSNTGKEILSDNYYFNDEINNNLRKEKMNVEVKSLPGYHVAYVRVLEGYKHEKIGKAFRKVFSWAGARDLFNEKSLVIGISYDDPKITQLDKCRYDACITIPEGIKPEGEIGVKDIAPGKYAVYHVEGTLADGANSDFMKYWEDLYRIWLPESGYQPDDRDCFEIYYEDPDQNPDRKFVADICMPIKPL